ncbi:MAG: aminotransferase class I/II-fold pyridoxal phosphate-dependent enzyme [Kiritimatiellia bacterium]|nr:aminotransferase class I/II-fold pyridoxal phosphate-dependent enzyme [Lentisphaerota bacterium]
MKFDPQAEQLNQVINESGTGVSGMLSQRGLGIFFPKQGILAQSAEAKGREINATIGIALAEAGGPLHLASVVGGLGLGAGEAVPYAPSPGLPDLRKAWADMLLLKNPSLRGKKISLPVVTSALTHGLSMCGYLFCDPGDTLLLPDLYWENYDLVFGQAWQARLETFRTFDGSGFNVAGLAEKLRARQSGEKALVLLNFPNNPTGYTVTEKEARALCDLLLETARRGVRVVVLIDDAYFGLVFEDGILRESLFAALCDLHPNLLAVKLDGPTKEDYVWGFRVGFLTFGTAGGTPELYSALEAKTAGAIRGSISNASCLSQNLLVRAYASPEYAAEKQAAYDILRGRYREVRRILAEHPEYAGQFVPLPFNSGYFMCIKTTRADPEKLRRKLIADYSTGVIAMGGVVRLAFSATPTEKLADLFANIYKAASELDG